MHRYLNKMDKVSDDVKQQVDQLKEWANRQPNLPKDIEDAILLQFLHSCYYDLDKSKVTLELFCGIRSSSPELFTNRDPSSPPMKKALQILNLAHYEIPGRRFVWIWQLNDPSLENYDYVQDAKVFMLTTDSWLLSDKKLEEDDMVIMDVKDISLKFITKFNVSVAKKLSKYQEDAMPIRLKQIHIVNAPPFVDKLYALLKPFMKQEITNMIHFHTPNSQTLYDFVKKEDLPSDYGGTRKSMVEFNKDAMELLESRKEILSDDNLWRVEKKSKNKNEFSSDVGSFRTLAID